MTADTAVVTVSTVNHFHKVRTLMGGVARCFPEAARVVCCVDADGAVAPETVTAHMTVNAQELGFPRFRQSAFALPATGLCCALKPAAALHAIERTGAECALYLDNDMALYRNPSELLDALETHSMVLTPHITEPLPRAALPNCEILQQYGIWNAGMFGARADSDALGFLRWWSDIMNEPRRLSGSRGWDQQWLEFAPSMIDKVKSLRDPSYNVAVWNLASRQLTRKGSGWEVNGMPLTTFHFSWFDENDPTRWLRTGASCNLAINEELVGLGEDYANALLSLADQEFTAKEYGFARYRNGQSISGAQRELVSNVLWDDLQGDEDLFDPSWTDSAIPGGGPLSRWEAPRTSASIASRIKRNIGRLMRV